MTVPSSIVVPLSGWPGSNRFQSVISRSPRPWLIPTERLSVSAGTGRLAEKVRVTTGRSG